ncbi:hypothetical protein N7466_001427 [Penicillium verhagenii]|uniref:uncharacterized protein n=1 Tax=Penicillium verhagenii TaxID=1562060 RepID=UPI002544E719|nr:uncharacterized protein N7466_001427 [Penicillium verhagenii]KAJ5938293.1 hypothetical protein N7466_001427 [Penicillium verhagenii]
MGKSHSTHGWPVEIENLPDQLRSRSLREILQVNTLLFLLCSKTNFPDNPLSANAMSRRINIACQIDQQNRFSPSQISFSSPFRMRTKLSNDEQHL